MGAASAPLPLALGTPWNWGREPLEDERDLPPFPLGGPCRRTSFHRELAMNTMRLSRPLSDPLHPRQRLGVPQEPSLPAGPHAARAYTCCLCSAGPREAAA